MELAKAGIDGPGACRRCASKVYRDARMMLTIYAAVILAMAVTGWWGLVWYWFIPLMLGLIGLGDEILQDIGKGPAIGGGRVIGPGIDPDLGVDRTRPRRRD